MQIRFDFDTDSDETGLRNKLREAKGIISIMESRLHSIGQARSDRFKKELDRRIIEDRDYF